MEASPLFFTSYKLLKYPSYPLSWLIALLLVTTGIALLPLSPGRLKWIRILLVSSTVLIAVLAMPVCARTALSLLEGWYPPFRPTSASKFDAIVVLAGGVHPQGSLRPQHELSSYSRLRTTCGADLLRQGVAPKLVLVGGDASLFRPGPSEAREMKRWAQRLGASEQAIITEEHSRNTYENAVNARRILGGGSILLVTSAYHIPRAVALFSKQGFIVTAAPCGYDAKDRPAEDLAQLNVTDFLPTVEALLLTSHAVDEFTGMLVQWATGAL